MAQQIEYRKTGFYGSNYIAGTAAPEFAEYPREAERKVVIPAPPQVREQPTTRAKARYAQSVSPAILLGLACAAVILVLSLMAKVQFTTVSDETVLLESRLAELKTEQSRLLIEYESIFNMCEIEKYATSQLGMQRPRDEQIFYLSSTVPDKAIVVDNREEKGLLGYLDGFLNSIGEYF